MPSRFPRDGRSCRGAGLRIESDPAGRDDSGLPAHSSPVMPAWRRNRIAAGWRAKPVVVAAARRCRRLRIRSARPAIGRRRAMMREILPWKRPSAATMRSHWWSRANRGSVTALPACSSVTSRWVSCSSDRRAVSADIAAILRRGRVVRGAGAVLGRNPGPQISYDATGPHNSRTDVVLRRSRCAA